jgi:hypothetical protein
MAGTREIMEKLNLECENAKAALQLEGRGA